MALFQRNAPPNMGQREAFSSQDVEKINYMYKCDNGQVNEEKPPLNAHNNINALIDNTDTTESQSPSSSSSPSSGHGASRPSRPLLHLVGQMINQALTNPK